MAYNPPGKEEGYLFWLPWFMHNSDSVVSIEDAHGVAIRGLILFGCTGLPSVILANPALAPLLQLPICPIHPKAPQHLSGSPADVRRSIEKWVRQTSKEKQTSSKALPAPTKAGGR